MPSPRLLQPRTRNPQMILVIAIVCLLVQLRDSKPLLAEVSRSAMPTARETTLSVIVASSPSTTRPSSSNKVVPATTIEFFGEDECFVPGKGRTKYRFPTRTFPNNTAPVVVGVLSTAHLPQERTKVRQSWALGRTNVFFLVSGNWTDVLEQEFKQHSDLIWINELETYRGVTVKVLVWLSAVNKHIPSAFVVKTDDDSYVRMIELEQIAKLQKDPLYLGFGCVENGVIRDPKNPWYVSRDIYRRKKFPKYTYGGGYILSADVNDCAVQHIQERLNDAEVFPIEDAFVGVLVEGCHDVVCKHDERFKTYSVQGEVPNLGPDDVKNATILHQVKSYEIMLLLHNEACCEAVADGFIWDQKSCAHVICPTG